MENPHTGSPCDENEKMAPSVVSDSMPAEFASKPDPKTVHSSQDSSTLGERKRRNGEIGYNRNEELGGPIYSEKHMRIVVCGAGASGLCFAYKLQRSFRNFSLTVFEKNSDISGTWFENRYPGYIVSASELCAPPLIIMAKLIARLLDVPVMSPPIPTPSPGSRSQTGQPCMPAATKLRATSSTLRRSTSSGPTSKSTTRSLERNGTMMPVNGTSWWRIPYLATLRATRAISSLMLQAF